MSAGVAWLVSSLAAAQTPDAPAALERVEVTAQRRVESVQSVGVAISVLSGDELAARGVTNVNKLQNELPSLEIEPAFGSGQPQFRIRGIGFQDYGSNNASAVSLYVDEVAFGYPVQTQGLLFDLERVEVLRGPQGTLYGKNTTGGAINLLTRKPTQTREGGFSLGYGSNQARSAQGYLSGPLSESLRGRLSLATEQGGAWQSNRLTGAKLGDKNIVALRGQLELDVTRDLKAHLSLSHNVDKSDVAGLYLFTARPSYGYAADRDRSKTGWGLAPDFATLVGVGADSAPSRDNSATQVALTLNWDLGATRLTSISSHQRFDRRELGDWDGTPINHSDVFWKDKASITTQELRLASNKTAAFNWVLGAYYAKEQLDEDWYTDFRRDFGVITRTKYTQSGKTWALFGQADTLLAPDLKLVAGLRREKEERGLRDFSTTFTNIPGSGLTGLSSSLDTGNTSGKLALEYQVAREQLVYVSLSRGIKSGGITAHNTFDPAALGAFQPEKLNSLELGYKADLNRTLRLNAALFHYDYRNQQFQDVITSNTGALVGKIVNIPRSAVRGGEVELQWRPLAGLTIGQAIGYKHATFKDFKSVLLGDLSGHDQFLPKLSYGGNVSYAWSTQGYAFKLAGDYSYRSKYESWLNRLNVDGGNVYDIPAYWLANARLEVSKAGAPWQLSLVVQNLFDRRYDLTRNFFGNRPATQDDLNVAAAGQPRTVGVTLSYEF
ncbi:TonB-dependent receptor [uncultured Aquincola sp.]|uniref:TonB-dependent receptor n=1 Tax=uncultured Aquincola sp. TaxID=886556 RepID=UPI0032B198BD